MIKKHIFPILSHLLTLKQQIKYIHVTFSINIESQRKCALFIYY